MRCRVKEDGLTKRVTAVRLKSETFDEERLLGLIVDGITHDGTLFELSREGKPCGSFRFSGYHEEGTQG